MRARNVIGAGLLLVWLSVLGTLAQGRDQPSPEPEGVYGTPKAVFDALNKAINKKDYKTFMKCMTPESQDRMTAYYVGMGAEFRLVLLDGDDLEKKGIVADFDKALAKHGLTKEILKKYKLPKDSAASARAKADKSLAAVVKDKPAFVNDILPILEKMDESLTHSEETALKDVKITGDKARGMAVPIKKGRGRGEPMNFVKIGRSWRIVLMDFQQDLKEDNPKGPPPPPPIKKE